MRISIVKFAWSEKGIHMRYDYEEKVSVIISGVVERQFLEYINCYDYKVEHGGIMAGILRPDKKQIVITDITTPQEGDICRTFSFHRSENKHQLIMDSLWRESQYTKTYLGEWHTHREATPTPSSVDRKNWNKIIKRQKNSDWIFFIIVGTKNIGLWTIENGRIVKMSERDIN